MMDKSNGTRVAKREITRNSGIHRRLANKCCLKNRLKEAFFGPCQGLFPPDLTQVAGKNRVQEHSGADGPSDAYLDIARSSQR